MFSEMMGKFDLVIKGMFITDIKRTNRIFFDELMHIVFQISLHGVNRVCRS